MPVDRPLAHSPERGEFDAEWSAALTTLRSYLLKMLRNPDLVADVLQETALRAFRGYGQFQRRSAFVTWVIQIARNEAIRAIQHRRPVLPIDDPAAADVVKEENDSPPAAGLADAIAEAVQARMLTPAQAAVLEARQNAGEGATWERIGSLLGIKPNHCAVLHHRGILDLRVYLFLFRPDLFGGRTLIEPAIVRATKTPIDPLTPEEEAAFRRAVLAASPSAKARGELEPLRSACNKVARQLDPLNRT
jgi:RNA polymerase sigma factor (sigma-70 family)